MTLLTKVGFILALVISTSCFGRTAAAAESACPGSLIVPGATIETILQNHGDVDCRKVRIEGPVDLNTIKQIKQVDGSFRCIGCVFTDKLTARNVEFRGIVDLRGSIFEQEVSFEGATFNEPARFGALSQPATEAPVKCPGSPDAVPSSTIFKQSVDFSFATFEGQALFDRVQFCGAAKFNGSDFQDQASFLSSSFGQKKAAPMEETDFSESRFRDRALFTGVTLESDTTLEYARFEDSAIFRGAVVDGSFTFADGFVGKDLDFSSVTVGTNTLEFGRIKVAGVVNFNDATLAAPKDLPESSNVDTVPATPTSVTTVPATPTSVEQPGSDVATIVCRISFQFASIGTLAFSLSEDSGSARSSLALDLVASDGLIDTIILPKSVPTNVSKTTTIESTGLRLNTLEGSPDWVDYELSHDNQKKLLSTIEDTAKHAGDLGSANEAAYRRRVLESHDHPSFLPAVDYLTYRGIAGYLVRPTQPFIWLSLTVLVGTVLRYLKRRNSSPSGELVMANGGYVATIASGGREKGKGKGIGKLLASIWRRVVQSFADTITGRGSSQPVVRLVERVVQIGLAALVVVSLANANPTLREVVDAAF